VWETRLLDNQGRDSRLKKHVLDRFDLATGEYRDLVSAEIYKTAPSIPGLLQLEDGTLRDGRLSRLPDYEFRCRSKVGWMPNP